MFNKFIFDAKTGKTRIEEYTPDIPTDIPPSHTLTPEERIAEAEAKIAAANAEIEAAKNELLKIIDTMEGS